MSRNKVTYTVPDDSVLFAYKETPDAKEENLSRAFTEAWKLTGQRALDKYIKQTIEQGEVDNLTLAEGERDKLIAGAKNDASEEDKKFYSQYVEEKGNAVFEERNRIIGLPEDSPEKTSDPKEILQKSFAVLQKSGFSEEVTNEIAEGAGNNSYLRAYMDISKEKVILSEAGNALLEQMQSMQQNGYDVRIIRADHKREQHPEGGEVMQPETDKIIKEFPSLDGKVEHSGMVKEGGDYVRKLPLEDDEINIVVASADKLKLRTSDKEKEKLTGPMVEQLDKNNINFIAVNLESKGMWEKLCCSKPKESTINLGKEQKEAKLLTADADEATKLLDPEILEQQLSRKSYLDRAA